jgi:hypothetical protein
LLELNKSVLSDPLRAQCSHAKATLKNLHDLKAEKSKKSSGIFFAQA